MAARTDWNHANNTTLVTLVAKAQTAEDGFKEAAPKIGTTWKACQQHYYVLKKAPGGIKQYLPAALAAALPDEEPALRGSKSRIQWTKDDLIELLTIVEAEPSVSKGVKAAKERWPDRRSTVIDRYYKVHAAGGVDAYIATLPPPKPAKEPKAPKAVRTYGTGRKEWTPEQDTILVSCMAHAKNMAAGARAAAKKLNDRNANSCLVHFIDLRDNGRLEQVKAGLTLTELEDLAKIGARKRGTEAASTPTRPKGSTPLQSVVMDMLSHTSITGYRIKKGKIIIYI